MEQLCINWSEECLQEHFIKSVFSSVLEDCSEEGVESLVEPIVFDPAPCIELIGNEVWAYFISLYHIPILVIYFSMMACYSLSIKKHYHHGNCYLSIIAMLVVMVIL